MIPDEEDDKLDDSLNHISSRELDQSYIRKVILVQSYARRHFVLRKIRENEKHRRINYACAIKEIATNTELNFKLLKRNKEIFNYYIKKMKKVLKKLRNELYNYWTLHSRIEQILLYFFHIVDSSHLNLLSFDEALSLFVILANVPLPREIVKQSLLEWPSAKTYNFTYTSNDILHIYCSCILY